MSEAELIHIRRQLWQLTSAPRTLYDEIYTATLNKALAYGSNTTPAKCTQSFTLMISALKLRRGYLLVTPGGGVEVMASEEAAWTFAIFAAALWQNLLPPDVLLPDRMQWLSQHLPPKALAWLKRHDAIYALWQGAFIGEDNIITALLAHAQWALENETSAKEVRRKPEEANVSLMETEEAPVFAATDSDENKSAPLLPEPEIYTENASSSSAILTATDLSNADSPVFSLPDFLSWLKVNIPAEADSAEVFYVSEGLFIAESVWHHYAVHSLNLSSPTDFLLLINNYLYPEKNKQSWQFRPRQLTDRRLIQGIILQKNYLLEEGQHWPANHLFISSALL